MTASIAATALQLAVNQIRVMRIQLLARDNDNASQGSHPTDLQPGDSRQSLSSNSGPSNLDVELDQRTATTDLGSSPESTSTTTQTPTLRQSLENPTTKLTTEQEPTSLPGRLLRGMSTILPVQRLTDDEYLALLQRKRADVDKRLGEIANEEIRIFDWEEKRRRGSAPTGAPA